MKNLLLLISVLFLCVAAQGEEGKHLFILSGQSNMVGLNPDESFIPAVEAKFGKEAVIVVKDAQGGQPIRRWYKNWKPATGEAPKATGDLYDRLMGRVAAATKGQKIETVTFLWMQGERDAREKYGEVYARSLQGLLDQLADDLGRSDINCIIGRLSDFDMDNKRYSHWTYVRKAQVEFAEASPRRAWVDTDDLNDGKNRRGQEIENDLHYSAEGYKELGRRFAEKAIGLIRPVIFEEDFEKGHDRWETTDEKSWTHREVDGNHVFGINRRGSDYKPDVRSPYHIALIKNVEVADFVLTFRVRSTMDTGNHRDCCVFFNYQDPQRFYYVHLGARPDPHSGQIMIVNKAPRKALTQNKNRTPWKNDTWHQVKLVRDTASGRIEVFFDDMTKPHMNVVDKTFGRGRVGIGSFDDMNDFDDIRLRGR
jgi:hypothetical protein